MAPPPPVSGVTRVVAVMVMMVVPVRVVVSVSVEHLV